MTKQCSKTREEEENWEKIKKKKSAGRKGKHHQIKHKVKTNNGVC